ncbi:unnamed protein product [Sympodiomycopsis kandeliae]
MASSQLDEETLNFKCLYTGAQLEARRFRPVGVNGGGANRPAIVLGHGLGAVKEMGLQNYARLFASRGYVCVSFDYRHFGGSEGTPRQLIDIPKQRQDWESAIAFTRSLEEVNAEQIGIFGSSFGGGHVIVTAAEDPRIKATISQCPFTSGIHSALRLSPLSLPSTLVRWAGDMLLGWGDRSITIPVVGKPGESALLNSPDSMPGYQNVIFEEAKGRFKNEVCARVALKIPLDYPGARSKDVKSPIFFAICGDDSVAPPGPSIAYAKQAPRGQVEVFDKLGHFSIYVDEGFQKATEKYLVFLQQNLPVEST